MLKYHMEKCGNIKCQMKCSNPCQTKWENVYGKSCLVFNATLGDITQKYQCCLAVLGAEVSKNENGYKTSMAYRNVCEIQRPWNVEVVTYTNKWANGCWDTNEMTWKNQCTNDCLNDPNEWRGRRLTLDPADSHHLHPPHHLDPTRIT